MKPTKKQQAIIDSIAAKEEGKFIIKACPGSGKTFSVAHLLLRELDNWKSRSRGIAVLSFTNKAGEEVQAKIEIIKGQRSRINHPHFIGTFDTFFNNQVLFPFARGALRLPREPELVGEPHGAWRGYKNKGFYSAKPFEALRYTIDGDFAQMDTLSVGMLQRVYDNKKSYIHNLKREINADGYMTQSDAVFFSRKILYDNKYLARLLASRYPYIIIDEVQDSNAISMSMVDLLLQSGVKKVVLIGDPSQAIYEWNDANPNAFLDKWLAWKDRLTLDDSHRSSEAICNFVSKFSHGEGYSSSPNCPSKGFGIKPFLRSCDMGSVANRPQNAVNEIQSIKDEFIALCMNKGIEISTSTVAIVCRGKDDLAIIKNGADQSETYADWTKCSKRQTREICKAKFYYEKGDFPRAFRHWIVSKIYDHPGYSTRDDEAIRKYQAENGGVRKLLGGCVQELDKYSSIIDVDLSSWVNINCPGEETHLHLSNIFAEDAFARDIENHKNQNEPLYSTIHGVKGATFDAILVFLKSKGGRGSINYNTYIKDVNKPLCDSEDMRVVYVAFSRPRKLLMIAVPSKHIDDWRNSFRDYIEDPAVIE